MPAKPDNQTVAKSAVKPAAKTAAKVAAQLPAKPTVTVEKTAVKIAKTPAKTPAKTARSAPAPVIVEPTPRPLGKRAAKKVMMEQMTQAAVVPTHAPDAAKATFSTMNERAVMTPPVPSSIQKDPTRADNWKSLSIEQMTDQDVLAMPDSEYMSDLQLAYFRRKLSQLKADMLANAGETTEHLREDTVVVPDPADRATIEEEHALELRTRDRERKLLKKIEQAIARIDAGDYGYCEETGEVIGVGRLMARPTASLSLEAQQRRELKQKMFGD
ncbi:MAG: RNA polymerase-binding protein DksA [Hydrogenophaga sp.]|nr:RNA polymerase-binding protein DksA [Hydrogenophaga sp.]MDO9484341.1 RNA polymerase-binding protein DksA [Hydrogenophaga sp.]MDO9568191.1 RNA polymerase-binding protein DksA [Hydrogenophaga sp.]MDP3345177.1 RNA polymerase-binding protein DksA [Hydrogenophaga sp.]MDP3373227.1 RNA polymerase-binding protein DksA [Hydrogenophaga sp.]MDP3807338.1 RNA polymerase-binding protein DksA [Hydrogenophaga sp.]